MNALDYKKTPIKKILIFGPNWVGDTIMSTPLVSSLRTSLTQADITVAAKTYLLPLWKMNPDINRIWEIKAVKKYDAFFYFKLLQKIKKQKFDLVIILPHCLRYALISLLANIPYRIGYSIGIRGLFLSDSLTYTQKLRKNHMVENYLNLLELIGIKPSKKKLTLDINPNTHKAVDNIFIKNGLKSGDLIIGLAPGAAYGRAKRWPKDKYAGLAAEIIKKHKAKVIIFIGPEEKKFADEFKSLTSNLPLIFVDNSSLLEVSAIIKYCLLFIGNDSGLIHIANAIGVNTIAIFGSTSPQWTRPYGKNSIIIKKELDCSPCFKKSCPYDTYKCLESIEVKEVLRHISSQLKA